MMNRSVIASTLVLALLVVSVPAVSQESEFSADAPNSTATAPPRDKGWLTDPAVIEEEQEEALLNRIFPLWKGIAKGHTLPRPWSLGLVMYWQQQDYGFVEGAIKVGNLPPYELDLSQVRAEIDSKSVGLKGGLWLLPFLNLTGTVGYTGADSNIFLIGIPVGIIPPSPPAGDPEIIYGEKLLELDFTGPYISGSATFVGGWKRVFGSLTLSYARAELDSTVDILGEMTIKTQRAFPKLGFTFEGTSVWIGAQWMDEESHQVGSLDDGFFMYDVLITRTDWTPAIGMHTILGKHWELTVEGGFGDRPSAMSSLGYRF